MYCSIAFLHTDIQHGEISAAMPARDLVVCLLPHLLRAGEQVRCSTGKRIKRAILMQGPESRGAGTGPGAVGLGLGTGEDCMEREAGPVCGKGDRTGKVGVRKDTEAGMGNRVGVRGEMGGEKL